jgi:hypothetical protein
MSVMWGFLFNRFGVATAIILLSGVAVFAQEADEELVNENEEIEEIIVVEPKPGTRKRIDQEYEDPLRARILKDLNEMKADEEEYEWRKSAASKNPSRIKWGYDPRDEYRMRNEIDLQDFPGGGTKPATLIRYKF